VSPQSNSKGPAAWVGADIRWQTEHERDGSRCRGANNERLAFQ